MKILITGAAGFIGFHLSKQLVELGDEIIGLDNINEYYDISLKYSRLAEMGISQKEITYNKSIRSINVPNYYFVKLNLEDKENLDKLFKYEKFDIVCNLAAQAGVRYSIENPSAYIQSNIVGYLNILENCRHNKIEHLVYASSSSVYGNCEDVPFKESQKVNKPVSLYAATKISNELMAYTYSHLYRYRTTGLRFFTVYGPWGRPDMAPIIFTKNIIEGKPIKVFNNGDLYRDFTFIDDIIDGVLKVIKSPLSKIDNYKIYNIGSSNPVLIKDFIELLESVIGKKAKIEYIGMQDGDVYQTYADINELKIDYDYKPKSNFREGLIELVNWYMKYYGSQN